MKHTQTLRAVALAIETLIIVVVSLATTTLASAPLKELVNEAHRAYTQSDLITTLTIYKKILQNNPKDPTLLYNYAHFLKDADDIELATFFYQKVIALQPNNRAAHFGLSQCYLTLGEFEQGWSGFRYRSKDTLHFPIYNFDTMDLHNKRILTRCEWGMGDMIQFVRYAKELKKRGAIVYVQTYKALKPIFLTCPYIDKVIAVGELFPAHDIQIPLLDLPHGCNTTFKSIPNEVPYLYPNKTLMKKWQNYFDIKKINIGLCWSGNGISEAPLHVQKNIDVTLFAPLLNIENVVLHSIQKTKNESFDTISTKSLRTGGGINSLPCWLHQFDENFDVTNGRFMDTAAVMKCLDLVITIDTSIAHLAGALAVPVWVLLPYKADWRWLQSINWSPWYPTMQLFRQKIPGNWQDVIQKMVNELEKLT